MATLISKDKTLQVRTAKHRCPCYGQNKWWRSPLCSGTIQTGDTNVVKVELGQVAGRIRWIRDLRHYCQHCALVALTPISVGEEKAA